MAKVEKKRAFSPVEYFLSVLFPGCLKGISLTPEECGQLLVLVFELFKTLAYREREVLKLRHGLGDDGVVYNLTDAAKVFGVTRERVRQCEAKALMKAKMRSRMMTMLDGVRGIGLHSLADNILSLMPQEMDDVLQSLTVRTRNILARAGVMNLEDLKSKSREDLGKMFIEWPTNLQEILDFLGSDVLPS